MAPKQNLETTLRLIQRRRGIWLRALLCLAIGLLSLTTDEKNSYDIRLKLRGDQSILESIVLVMVDSDDFINMYQIRSNNLIPIKEIADVTDSFYWIPSVWTRLIPKILEQKPAKVGVSLFFSESLGTQRLSPAQIRKLKDPRVVWASGQFLNDRANYPIMANDLRSNIGSYDLLRDDDGVIRKFVSPMGDNFHLVEKLSGEKAPPLDSRLINFRGQPGRFPTYSMREILQGKVPQKAFENKIVIIGSSPQSQSQFMTPLGPMSRSEIFAHIVDNFLEKRWIQRLPIGVYSLGLLILVLFSVFLLTQYPQSVAFALLTWLGLTIMAASAWVFDQFYIWIPFISPTLQLFATWIIFLGYQVNRFERKNWQLKKEQEYLQELEQLKNNFVSLISHDLKTPIAKIQSTIDRLILQNPGPEVVKDLSALRNSSDELNRYIQSILKVLRIESRDFKLHREVGDINETIEDVIQSLKPLADSKNIAIEFQAEPLFSIEVDFTLIREVIVNLVENAIKYTNSGGVVKITATEEENEIIVSVEDTGEGIAPEDLKNVWLKFVRGKDQDLKTKGHGLGLYLVKYFIELHGGKIDMSSQIGTGTKVTFRLPLETDEREPTKAVNL